MTPEKYEVKAVLQEAAIVLTSCSEPKMQVTITLTSPVIRDETGPEGGLESHHYHPVALFFYLVFLLSLYDHSQYVGCYPKEHRPAGTPQ